MDADGPNQARSAAATAELPEVRTTADGSSTLFDPVAGQTYHSERGAHTETQHVFLRGSGLLEALHPGRTARVVEVGLGTGANLLASWDAARLAGARLHYRGLEVRPPAVEAVRTLHLGASLEHPDLLDLWLGILEELERATHARAEHAPAAHARSLHARARSSQEPRWHTFTPSPDLHLEVALGDATLGPDGAPSGAAARALEADWAEAIYHDAFSRDATPRLWSAPFLTACARALAPGGAWVSYSVAGDVRRRLTAAGLIVRKQPGPPGGKREMLHARRPL